MNYLRGERIQPIDGIGGRTIVPEHSDWACLSNAVHAVDGLQVNGWRPPQIRQEDIVSTRQRDPHSARFDGAQNHLQYGLCYLPFRMKGHGDEPALSRAGLEYRHTVIVRKHVDRRSTPLLVQATINARNDVILHDQRCL